jgi:hypothetical protein
MDFQAHGIGQLISRDVFNRLTNAHASNGVGLFVVIGGGVEIFKARRLVC